MASALLVNDLHKEYPTPAEPLVVLRGVNLNLTPGESLAILGPSGSGKSTLLNILGTLDTPTTGKISFDGTDPFSLKPAPLAHFRAHNIGFVFQDHHLLPQCTALENILITKLADGKVTADDENRAKELLAKVGLTDRASHLPSELSGGERQRIAIARALMNKPTLLLCDEPTGDLDRKSGDEILDLLQALNKQHGKTIVMVTHDPRAAERANRTLHLEKGRLERES